MKKDIKELIVAERRRTDFAFIVEVIQRGRIKPAKYIHSITMPVFLYEQLRDAGVIRPEDYYIDSSAFFEFKDDKVTISFINLYMCEDLHRNIDRYIIWSLTGSYPIMRTGQSRMNFDVKKKPDPIILKLLKNGEAESQKKTMDE